MVQEIREKNLFELIRQSSREIGHKTLFSYALLSMLVIVVGITFVLTQTRQNIIQSASYDATTRTFTETFDGDPASPQNFTQIGQNNWDVQVHSRNNDTWIQLETIQAQHGHDCSAPPASHPNSSYEGSVFNCRNHLMTSINSSSYGAIYLTPNHMADFSNAPAVIRFDLSTEKMSSRDWWDITVSPFLDSQALPLLSDLSQGVDLQEPNRNSVVIATDNGEGGPNLKVMRNGNREDYDGVQGWWNIPANEGITAGTNQAATRQPFQLTISRNHIKFERLASPTGQAIVFVDTDIPTLSWSTGVVQLGHHSYTPTKDDAGSPATWHWDAVSISPATPFTMIKADKRFTQGGVVNFNSPAPANSYLRFSGICAVRVDGVTVPKQTDSNHPEHMSSYFVPIAEGKSSVNISFANDSWYSTGHGCIAKDFAIWSTTVTGNQNPVSTIQPTVSQPTLAPTSPPITNPPTPTITSAPTPQSTISIIPATGSFVTGQTFTAEVRLNTNGQSVNGVETTINYPPNLQVESVTNGTSFDVEAEKTLSSGKVTLAYGATVPRTGTHTIATITFRAASSGTAPVTLTNSAVAESNFNTDVLKNVVNANYTITTPTPSPTPTPTPTPSPTPTPAGKPGDINRDAKVDIQDLSYLLTRWNSNDSLADLNKDGRVNTFDLSMLLSNWGK